MIKICIHCDEEFNVEDKLNQAKRESRYAGKVNECINCASAEPVRLTGVMIYGHKTAGTIQINKDPRITQYMIAASPSQGSRCCMVQCMPKSSNGVALEVKDVAKRRE